MIRNILRSLVFAIVLVACNGGRLSPQGGTITSVQGGNGLTGGGTGGAVTLNVACGYGLTCLADSIEVNNSVFPDGSGTAGYIPLWTPDGNTLGNSPISYNGTDTLTSSVRHLRVSTTAGLGPVFWLEQAGQVGWQMYNPGSSNDLRWWNSTYSDVMTLTQFGNLSLNGSSANAETTLSLVNSGTGGRTYQLVSASDASGLNPTKFALYDPNTVGIVMGVAADGDVSTTYDTTLGNNDTRQHTLNGTTTVAQGTANDGLVFTAAGGPSRSVIRFAGGSDELFQLGGDGLGNWTTMQLGPTALSDGGQLQLSTTLATIATGDTYLSNATQNFVRWNNVGVAPPTFNTRSAGTRLVLWPEVGASSVDFALGIESATMWHSVPQNTGAHTFKWYGGTSNIMTLYSQGVLALTYATAAGAAKTQLIVDGNGHGNTNEFNQILLRNGTNYNTFIRQTNTRTSPDYLNPRLDFGVQNAFTLGEGNAATRMSLLPSGDDATGGGAWITYPGAVINNASAGYLLKLSASTGGIDTERYMIGFTHGGGLANNTMRAGIGAIVKGGGNGMLVFETGPGGAQEERMRIDDAGEVGISGVSAATDPLARLDVRGKAIFSKQSSAVAAPLVKNVLEANVAANSLITLGENADGDANPAITLYRTSSGFRQGTAARLYLASSNFDFRIQQGTNDAVYGAETYTDALTIDANRTFNFYPGTGGGVAGIVVNGEMLGYNFMTTDTSPVFNMWAAAGDTNTYFTNSGPGDAHVHIDGSLYVQNAVTATGAGTFRSSLSDGTMFGHTVLLQNTVADNAARLSFEDTTSGAQEAQIRGSRMSGGGGYLGFWTRDSGDGNMAERVRMDRSGQVRLISYQNDGVSAPTQSLVFSNNVNGSGPWGHGAIWSVGSSGFNGDLVFGTDGDSVNNINPTEKMRIKYTGRVGIAEDNPQALLELRMGRDSGGNVQGTNDIAFGFGGGGGFRHWISTQHNINPDAGNAMRFWINTNGSPGGSSSPGTGNVNVLTLTGAGRAGIGVADPGSLLEVQGGYTPTNANTAQLRISESVNYRLNIGYDEASATTAVFDNSYNDGVNSRMSFRFGNTEKCAITANGNLTCTGTISGSAGGSVSGLTATYIPVAQSDSSLVNSSLYQIDTTDLVNTTYQFASTDALYSGTDTNISNGVAYGKIRRNWVIASDHLDSTLGAFQGSFYPVNYPGVITHSIVRQVSPRGIYEDVGAVICSQASCSADFRSEYNSASTPFWPYKDTRNRTFTFSVWAKSASGNQTLTLSAARDNDAGGFMSTNCSINASTWTRCTTTGTANSTSYADNSEMRFYMGNLTNVTYYLYGAQIEESPGPTPYQRNEYDILPNDELAYGGYAVADINANIRLRAVQPGSFSNGYTIQFSTGGPAGGTFTDGVNAVYSYSSGVTTYSDLCADLAGSTHIAATNWGSGACTGVALSVTPGTYTFANAEDSHGLFAFRGLFGGTAQAPLVVANAPDAALRTGQESWGSIGMLYFNANVTTGETSAADLNYYGSIADGYVPLHAIGASKFTGQIQASNAADSYVLSISHNPSYQVTGVVNQFNMYTAMIDTQATFTGDGGTTHALSISNTSLDNSRTNTTNRALTLNASGADTNWALYVESGDVYLGPNVSVGALSGKIQTVATGGVIDDLVIDADTTAIRFTGASVQLNGIAGGYDGRILYIIAANTGATTTGSVNLANEQAGSTAANRFTGYSSSNYVTSRSVGTIIYDGTTQRWRNASSQYNYQFYTGSLLSGATVSAGTGGFYSGGQVLLGDTSPASIANNVDVLEVGNTGTGQTASTNLVDLSHTGSFDTTAALRTNIGLRVVNTATRSAGANSLLNYGVYVDVNGGQTNYAFFNDRGDNRFNETSGSSRFGGNVTIVGTLDVPVVNGWTLVQRSTDQDDADTTLSDDNTLQFSCTAGVGYMVEGLLLLGAAGTGIDAKYRFIAATGNIDVRGLVSTFTTADASVFSGYGVTNGVDSGTVAVGTTANIDVPSPVVFQIATRCASTTTWKVQFAANAAGTARMHRGSYLRYRAIE